MNPQPAPTVPGKTEWERFDNAVRKVFSVPPEAIQNENERLKQKQAKKKQPEAQAKSPRI